MGWDCYKSICAIFKEFWPLTPVRISFLLNILTLKVPRKMHLKMSSAEVVCCKKKMPNITDKLNIEANSLDPEQTAPILFAIEASLTFQQTRKADYFCCDWRIKG